MGTRRENVWKSETKTARCLWTPYPHEVIHRDVQFSPTGTNLPSLSAKQSSYCAVLYFPFSSADSLFFQELFSKSPPQLRHTLEHNSLRLKIAPCKVTQTLVNRKRQSPRTGDNGQQVLTPSLFSRQMCSVFRSKTFWLRRKETVS